MSEKKSNIIYLNDNVNFIIKENGRNNWRNRSSCTFIHTYVAM